MFGPQGIFIVRLVTFFLAPAIHQHIARAGVIAHHFTIGLEHRNISNPPDIEHDHGRLLSMKNRAMKRGN
ncbi:Uncharacterised protein [Vibrio cholerae]|nr:Uncharacterised protein [Vibrio cholerae]CSI46890.1 Uncharacterised protein [Vibrio cholerae]